MTKSLDTKNGEVVGTIIGYVGIVLVVLVPFIIIVLLFNSIETLKKDTYINRWGILYEGLKMHNKFQLAFYLFFLLRRLFFILIVFNFIEYSLL